MPSDTLLKMGAIGRPHGIKGELGVDWYGEYVPEAGNRVFLQQTGHPPIPHVVNSVRPHKGRLLLTLQGINTRNDAEAVKGWAVLMKKSDLPGPHPDEVFLADLPGCDIYLSDGHFIGKLDHIEFPAGQSVWAIHAPDGKEILFPAVPEFILSIEPAQKKAIINPPEGLLDLYNA